jgi:hypothetical protein
MNTQQIIIELYRLAFGLQTAALDSTTPFSAQNRARIHNLVAKYLNLSSQLLAIPALCQHVQQVSGAYILYNLMSIR